MVTLVRVPRLLFRALACATFEFLWTVAPARANTIIDFKDAALIGGTVSYDGNGGALVGANIVLQYVLGLDTPSELGAHGLTGALLNFSTGGYSGGSGSTYNFSNGGSFQITGKVDNACDLYGTLCNTSDVLLTGSFLGATVNGGGVTFTGGTDTKNSALLAFFGLPANTQFAFGPANVQFNPSYGQNGSFSGTAYSTDVSNTVVPEPGSMMLFGSGLVGLSTLIRRRRQQKS